MPYKHTDLGYLFVTGFRYRLIRESLIFCHIFGCKNGGQLTCGTAYTRVYTVVDMCPLTKFKGGLQPLHCVDDIAVKWLETTEITALAKLNN